MSSKELLYNELSGLRSPHMPLLQGVQGDPKIQNFSLWAVT